MISSLKNNKKGFTLLEMLIAMSVFITIFVLVGTLIVDIVRMQRRARAMRTIQEEARYVLEEITRQGRLARKFLLGNNQTQGGSNTLTLKFPNDVIKTFSLESGKLTVRESGQDTPLPLTSDKVIISQQENSTNIFNLVEQSSSDNTIATQFLTIKFKIEPNPTYFPGIQDVSAEFQTGITLRNYNAGS